MDLIDRILSSEAPAIWHKYIPKGWEFKIKRLSMMELFWIEQQKEYFWLEGKLAERPDQKIIFNKKLACVLDWRGIKGKDFMVSGSLSREEQDQEIPFHSELLRRLVSDSPELWAFISERLTEMAVAFQKIQEEEKKI
jgi:hypothetical protein